MRDRIREIARTALLIFKHAGKEYGIDRVNRMSAAVAYRAIFAMAPLLILTIYVVGLVVGGSDAAQTEIVAAIDRVAGPTVVSAVETILEQMADTSSVAGIVSVLLLLWTSSSLFLELQTDLNDIFDVPYGETTGIMSTIRKRGLGFLWALSLGLILILVLLLNNVWQFLGSLFPESFDPAHELITLLTPLVSIVVLPFVIILIFQSLTRLRVQWRAVWWGSFFTAVAFLLTAYGVSLYFRLSGDSAAELVGALFVILLAAYVFSAVFLFGAEVTKAYEIYLRTGRPPGAPVDERAESFVEPPDPAMPVAAVLGFLAGLFVGWRRRS